MEMLAILIVLVIIAVWYGLFDAVEVAAEMATDEVKVAAAERKATNIDRIAGISIDAEKAKKASENLAQIRSIKL